MEPRENAEAYLRMYRQMVKIRTFEDNANQLYLDAKMPGLTHMYSGEEAVAVGICEALRVTDKITSTHRGHGHCVAKGAAFREKYRAKFPGTMGMVYTGGGYDAVMMLKAAWEEVGNPDDFDAVGNAIRKMEYRGINGFYKFDPETNSGISYPNMTDDPEGGQARLFFQVQDNEHRIIAPSPFAEVEFQDPPWW